MLINLLTAALVGGALGAPDEIRCEFPGTHSAETSIVVTLVPRPSLKDQPGAYRVMMDLNERVVVRAAAKPIDSTEDRDVLIRGFTKRNSMYTIGLRADGKAALNMQSRASDDAEVTKSTRVGHCRGFETVLDFWLTS